MLSRKQIQEALTQWNRAWDEHDSTASWNFFIRTFCSKTGPAAGAGKEALRKAWSRGSKTMEASLPPGGHFHRRKRAEGALSWILEWPSGEKGYEGKQEKRRGWTSCISRTGRSSARVPTLRPRWKSKEKG